MYSKVNNAYSYYCVSIMQRTANNSAMQLFVCI